MADSQFRADDACLGNGSSGGLCLGLCLGLVALLALQSRHVVVVLFVVLFLLILAAQTGTASKLREVDAAEVTACA